ADRPRRTSRARAGAAPRASASARSRAARSARARSPRRRVGARARRSCPGPRDTPSPRATADLLRSAPRRYISRISDSERTSSLKTQMPSSLEIAQRAALRPVAEIAAEAGLEPDEVELYGRYK